MALRLPKVVPPAGSLWRQLFLTHMVVGLVGITAMVVAFSLVSLWRENTRQLREEQEPALRAATQLWNGVQEANSNLHEWLYLADPVFIHRRRQIWSEQIQTALVTLESLSKEGEDPSVRVYYRAIQPLLTDLQKAEDRVESIAQTRSNEPARKLYVEKISPLSNRIFSSTTAIIDATQREIATEVFTRRERKDLLGFMTDLYGNFARSDKFLLSFIESGRTQDENQYRSSLAIAQTAHRSLKKNERFFPPQLLKDFRRLSADLEAFQNVSGEISKIRNSEDWNLARTTYTNDVLPLTLETQALVESFMSQRKALVNILSERTRWLSNLSVSLMTGLVLALSVIAVGLSFWHSKTITRPIAKLADAANQITEGKFSTALDPPRSRELKDLTESFIRMQAAVEAEIETKKRLEIALESNSALEQFAFLASHDLKEPLRTIESFAQLIRRNPVIQSDAKLTKHLGFIEDAAFRLQAMISSLLLYARIDGQQFEPIEVDMNIVIENVRMNLQSALTEAGGTITAANLPKSYGDPSLLTVLLQNLSSNSIKFQGKEPIQILVSGEAGPDGVLFCVKDNGIGMRSDLAEEAFQMFRRLHDRTIATGSGIGLSICKRIVERHGGWIEIHSAPNEGCEVRFCMPTPTQIASIDLSEVPPASTTPS